MAKLSAGILLYKIVQGELMFFLVHPGGPFFKNKDAGWWTIPKGEPAGDEDLLETALREFTEETGFRPDGTPLLLKPVTQKAGKVVHCWAVEGDLDPERIVCNTFELEWPPRSGRMQEFAEVDRAGWFTFEQAAEKINERQMSFLRELRGLLC